MAMIYCNLLNFLHWEVCNMKNTFDCVSCLVGVIYLRMWIAVGEGRSSVTWNRQWVTAVFTCGVELCIERWRADVADNAWAESSPAVRAIWWAEPTETATSHSEEPRLCTDLSHTSYRRPEPAQTCQWGSCWRSESAQRNSTHTHCRTRSLPWAMWFLPRTLRKLWRPTSGSCLWGWQCKCEVNTWLSHAFNWLMNQML